MIFVDTGAWYASIVVDDQHHLSARRWLDTNAQPLLTSDYIVDEALTLLQMRGHGPAAMELGRMLFAGELAELVLITEEDLREAWRTFGQFADKQWSFTDCTSRAVMRRLNLTHDFTFDHHFRQFGTVQVVP